MNAPATRTAFTMTVRDAIRDGYRAQLEQKVSELICEISLYRGARMQPTDALTVAGFYLRDLEADFPLLNTTDIRGICWAGVKGAYGDYFGISALTLRNWTAAWVDSPDGQAVIAERSRAQGLAVLPPKREKSAEELDREVAAAVNDAYDRWLHGWKPDYPEGSIGDELRKSGYTSFRDPLRDLGGFKLAYLRDHGYTEPDLLTLYRNAKAAGKTALV